MHLSLFGYFSVAHVCTALTLDAAMGKGHDAKAFARAIGIMSGARVLAEGQLIEVACIMFPELHIATLAADNPATMESWTVRSHCSEPWNHFTDNPTFLLLVYRDKHWQYAHPVLPLPRLGQFRLPVTTLHRTASDAIGNAPALPEWWTEFTTPEPDQPAMRLLPAAVVVPRAAAVLLPTADVVAAVTTAADVPVSVLKAMFSLGPQRNWVGSRGVLETSFQLHIMAEVVISNVWCFGPGARGGWSRKDLSKLVDCSVGHPKLLRVVLPLMYEVPGATPLVAILTLQSDVVTVHYSDRDHPRELEQMVHDVRDWWRDVLQTLHARAVKADNGTVVKRDRELRYNPDLRPNPVHDHCRGCPAVLASLAVYLAAVHLVCTEPEPQRVPELSVVSCCMMTVACVHCEQSVMCDTRFRLISTIQRCAIRCSATCLAVGCCRWPCRTFMRTK